MESQMPSAIDREEFVRGLETVKELESSELESYVIVKDQASGQHYLHYQIVHIALAEGGKRVKYDHFLPLDSDDVLAILFGEQAYQFPEHWRTPYLRSGTDHRLMPFDPSGNHDLEKEAQQERDLLAKLQAYKQAWLESTDKEKLTRDLFADLDQILKKEDE